MDKRQRLSANEVMSGIYEMFRANGLEMKFPEAVKVAVCEEAGTDYGYFAHEAFVIVKIGKQSWAVTLGRAETGALSEDIFEDFAREYDCDLVAMKLPEVSGELLLEAISSALKKNVDRQLSLLSSKYDGCFQVSDDGMFGPSIKTHLPLDGKCFLAQKPRYCRDGVQANCTPIVVAEAKYYAPVVKRLYEIFLAVLATIK
jgi:hypothetical protein